MQSREYVLMLTQRCNFRCTYCYQAHNAVDQELQVIERLAAHLRGNTDRSTNRLVFHGGEPLLRKDLLHRAVELLLDEQGVPVCAFAIVTNGSLIDPASLDLFSRFGFEVSVSFDGCREAQAFRDSTTFDRTVKSLTDLVELHESGRIVLKVSLTVTLDNLPYLGRSVRFLTELGIPKIEIEGDLYGPWIDGTEEEVERQAEEVTRLMEARMAADLPVPVSRLQPIPYSPEGNWWESDEATRKKRENRLSVSECSCSSANGSVIHADGSVWACPLYVPDLGKVATGRLEAREAFHHGSWRSEGAPSRERLEADSRAIRREPIMAPKRKRYSIFSDCESCPYVANCTVCPASSHLPDAVKPAEEVPPLLCALNMAFLSRRDRMRRPVQLMDVVRAVAAARS